MQAEGRLLPIPLQMKVFLPFADKCSEELECPKRLFLLSWNAGPRRGGVASSTLRSFRVTIVTDGATVRRQNRLLQSRHWMSVS